MRAISASATAEVTSLTWDGASPARWRATTVELRRLAASVSSRLFRALAIARRRTNGERVSAATRSMPTITPISLGARAEDRDVADVVIEHGQHHVRAGLVRGDAEHRGRHRRVHRVVRREGAGDHRERRSLSVTIPKSPPPRSTRIALTERASISFAASRRVVSGIDYDGRPAHQSARGLLRDLRTGGCDRVAVPAPTACKERAGQEAHAGGPGQQRGHVLRGQRVGQRVVSRPHLEPGGKAGEDRWVAEHLTLPEQIDGPAAVDQLHGASPDDPDAALRELALRDDRRSGGEELHLGLGGERVEVLLVEPAERVPPPQELGDVVHARLSRRWPRRPPRRSAGSGSPGPGPSPRGCGGSVRWRRRRPAVGLRPRGAAPHARAAGRGRRSSR